MYLKNNNEYVRKEIKANVGIPDDKIDQLVHYEKFNEDEWTVQEMYGYINKILNMWYKLCRDEFKYSYGDDREKHYEELWFKKVHKYTEMDIYVYAKLFDLGMVWASMYYGRKAY